MSTDARTLLPLSMFTSWLASGERGLSSEAIVANVTGQKIGTWGRNTDHPHDPADFRRCQLLMEQHPLVRLVFASTMTAVSPQWARLVAAWDEIDAAIESECPDYVTTRSGRPAHLGYNLMRRVIDDGIECATCHGTGQADTCPKCKGSGFRSGGTCRNGGCYYGHLMCEPCRGCGYTGGAA